MTTLALLAAGSLLVAGCGGDSDEEKAQQQVNSALSQAQSLQDSASSQADQIESQAVSQIADAQSQADSLLGSVTEDLPELTNDVTVATEAEVSTDAPADTTGSPDTGSAAAGQVDPAAVKSALEQATGLTLQDGPGSVPGQASVYSNFGTMVADGQLVMTIIAADPAVAEAAAAAMPQIPQAVGQTRFTHKNALVIYVAITGDDKSADVEAAVKAL